MAKSSIEKYKSFEKWKTQEVENEFGLKRVFDESTLLLDFFDKDLPVLSTEEKEKIVKLLSQLHFMIDAWNEYDLSMLFIGPIFSIVQVQNRQFRMFFNLALKAKLNNKKIQGQVGGMLAKGWQISKNRLFFLQIKSNAIETNKKYKEPNGDPLGQLLIEMVAAQAMNNHSRQAKKNILDYQLFINLII
jgi:hypothetical protein